MRRIGQSKQRGGDFSDRDLFKRYRLFVACEADEDIDYLARYIGEDNMIIGSDYGHNDPSEERELVKTMKSREDVPSFSDTQGVDDVRDLGPFSKLAGVRLCGKLDGLEYLVTHGIRSNYNP